MYLASRGVPVFPVKISSKSGTRNNSNKKPLITDNLNRASTDAAQIRRWWKQFPDAAIGGVLSALGWLVIDIDVHGDKDGFADLRRLEELFGPLPRTVTVRTATGGLHLWFQLPAGVEIRVSNVPGHVVPGVDIKGHGGWLVMPGSRSPFGEYTFEEGLSLCELRPADLPKRWLEALQVEAGAAARSPRQRTSQAASPTAYWEAVLDAISHEPVPR